VCVRLCTFRSAEAPAEGWPGRIDGDRVVRLEAPDLATVLARRGQVSEGPATQVGEAEFLAPVPWPPSVRDFYAFEQHIVTTRAARGGSVPREWYEFPVFYFSNPSAIFGPGAQIPYPDGTAMLDYELEVAAVIGADGEIGGFTIMNDWSARDIQRAEMRVGLGPAKGKDFATSLGPVVVTPDEFDGKAALMTARVNGEERSRGNLSDIHYSWKDIVAQAGRNTVLRPGEILGSGTVGTGCILEHGDGRWLRPGDTVELEVAGIGVLRNQVGPQRGSTEPPAGR
jgi:fumarylacetoacetate (FAA) hydrolase